MNGEIKSMLPLPGISQSGLPAPGCIPHTPCDDDFCENEGQCVDRWTNRHCLCAPGFIGKSDMVAYNLHES